MSRWGPPKSQSTYGNPISIEEDVELIEEVEWNDPNDRYSTGELADRPPFENPEPCMCSDHDCCRDESCVLFACQEECYGCSQGCGNQRISRRHWKKVEVFDAGPKGRGLRALEPIQKGDFVIEYVGRAIRKHYLEGLFRRYKTERMLYIMSLDNLTYIDARKKGGTARYINHSCDPNCQVQRWKVRGILRAAIFAVRNIDAGEELSFDYQWSRKKGRAPTKCHCRSQLCRGTLEIAKSLEEEELEQKLSSHWKKPPNAKSGREIINRSIKISDEYGEYYPADVCRYDESSGQHLVIYRNNLDEVWEDLSKEDWMILDEEAEHFVIAKKASRHASMPSKTLIGSGLNKATPTQMKGFKNYFFVTTPVKTELFGKGFIQKIQTRFHCAVNEERLVIGAIEKEQSDHDEDEIAARNRVLQRCTDGLAWKLTVTGASLETACSFLDINIAKLEQKQSEAEQSMDSSGNAADVLISEDIVIPRIAVDAMKKRLPAVNDRFRTVNISFVHSDSKSKQFAKLQLEGSLSSDLNDAKRYLWRHMLEACEETSAPTTPMMHYKDLGFYGGELSSRHFRLLFNIEKDVMSQECGEDMSKSAFFTCFESTKKCHVWVQAEHDMGRIDAKNRIVGEFKPDLPRKIYFGCDPKDVLANFKIVEARARELASGIRYFHLGADRLFQRLMMNKSGILFDYIYRISGASVKLDQFTGDHLRIDGGADDFVIEIGTWDEERRLTSSDRSALAEEIIRLQIELYRDHCIQQESWMFGRDWTIKSAVSDTKPQSPIKAKPMLRSGASNKKFERRQIVNSCMEIADVVSSMDLEAAVAGHAIVILYRYLRVMDETNNGNPNNLKIREISLGCLFLAIKAQQGSQKSAVDDPQKSKKMKRLGGFLQRAYKVVYSGMKFDPKSPEGEGFAQRVLLAETDILTVLNYDIFWRGVKWLLKAVMEGGNLDQRYASHILSNTLSGPVLAAGEELWLTHGIGVIFVAVAGFLGHKIEPLIGALSLVPVKIGQAAELIKQAILRNPSAKKSTYPLYEGGEEKLEKFSQRINAVCMQATVMNLDGKKDMSLLGETGQRYHVIGKQTKRRVVFKGVQRDLLHAKVLPYVGAISSESSCKIFVAGGSDAADIVLEGAWRALAVAEHLIVSACRERASGLPKPSDLQMNEGEPLKMQAKRRSGVLSMRDLDSSEGWEGTIQSKNTVGGQSWGRKIGGKACAASKVNENALREVGLRWWIPPNYVPSPTGSIHEMQCLQNLESGEDGRLTFLQEIAILAKALLGEATLSSRYPVLQSIPKRPSSNMKKSAERHLAVSMTKWPPEKIGSREQGRTNSNSLPNGFSPAALQELQLLKELHSVIPSPEGHPNLVLPIAVALPRDDSDGDANETDKNDDIFSLFRTSEDNEKRAQKEKKRKDLFGGAHIVFNATPFILQRVMSRSSKKKREDSQNSISPTLFACWFHDMLSALVHCHTNDVVLRSLQTDQIVIDHSGVAKIAGFYRATVLPPYERKGIDPCRSAQEAKEKGRRSEEDLSINPFIAPENLLGCPKYTKQTDIWAIGTLMGSFLLGKNLFVGKDRASLLAAMYKIVGTPAKENYPAAKEYPFYDQSRKDLQKKYKRNVEKAFSHMMKDEYKKHEKGVSLIAKMLHLDPNERITARDALKHEYMLDFLENSNFKAFRDRYVKDWMALKKKLAHTSRTEDDEAIEQEKTMKRKMMLEAAGGDGIDDLYDLDMDDIMSSTKKLKPDDGF